MMSFIKIAIAALVLYACWQAGSAYLRYYRFQDEVQSIAQFSAGKSESELQTRVMAAATRLQVPVAPERIAVRRAENQIAIDADYTDQIQLVPTRSFPWEFKLHTEALVINVAK